MNENNIFGFLFLFTQTFKVKVLVKRALYMNDSSFILDELTATEVFTVYSLYVRKSFLSVKLIHRLPLKSEWKSTYSDEGMKERTSNHLNRQTIYHYFHLSHFL